MASPIAEPGIAIRAWTSSVSFWPGTVPPFTAKPKIAAETTAARKAPTMPPQKRSGRKTVKCQTAMPIMTQTTSDTAYLLPCFFRERWRFGLGLPEPAVLVTRDLARPAGAPSPARGAPSPAGVGLVGRAGGGPTPPSGPGTDGPRGR